MRYIKCAVVLIVVLIIAGVALMYSGNISVAASEPHNPIVRWVLATAKERSIERHAEDISRPAHTADLRAGAAAYDEMCIACHGAPGKDPSELGKGLRPSAPDLTEEAGEMTEAELFWVIKHGIKMTGMPAWGETHTDNELWNIVAFVQQLPSMTPVQYQEQVAAARDMHGQSHSH